LRFNGTNASFLINSPTSITATVPSAATNGPIGITNDQGDSTSAALFYLPPVLTSFSPSAGSAGAAVTITGNNFIGATGVAFHGTSATFTVNGQDQLTAIVPAGSTTGTITVTTPYGPVSSALGFTVLASGSPTLTATATSATSVLVAWTGNAGDAYDVARIDHKNQLFSSHVIARVTGNSYVDSTALAGRTYLYNVTKVSTGVISNSDYATTIMFTDDPLTSATVVKAVHLTELRNAVNAMRAASALGAATWTDPNPAGVAIKPIHVTELRARLREALLAIGRYAEFSDPSLTAGMPVRKAHFTELRNSMK
ncbi:MAG: IPT/TIG domain-containing protein, partial [Thermoanaerobaculia bacterium]